MSTNLPKHPSFGASLAIYFGCAFVLHLLWEVLQMPLFVVDDLFSWQTFKMCLFATATGDMAFMLILYLALAVIHQSRKWIIDVATYRHPATWIITPLIGGLLAICFELWAVHAVKHWEYDTMPVLPVLKVGVTPLLQMLTIPVAVLCVTRTITMKAFNDSVAQFDH